MISRSTAGATLGYLALAAVLVLPGLGSLGLIRMEGMVAATAAEMIATGDYLIPRVHGEMFTYKPPLLYWWVAAGFELTGSTAAWVVRLPVALSSLTMGLVALFVGGSILGARAGFVAGLASLTGVLFLQKLRIAEFDAVLAAWVGVAVALACFALSRREGGGWVWWLGYCALAVAVLTKGVPALMMFFPGLLMAALATGRVRALLGWRHLSGLVLLLGGVGIYLFSAYQAEGASIFRQPFEEASARGTEWDLESGVRTVLKPLLIWAYFLPWSVSLFWARRAYEARDEREQLRRAAWAFATTGAFVWMTVPTDESRYYLPLAVPLALLAAVGLSRMESASGRWSKLAPVPLATLGSVLAVGLAVIPASPATSLLSRSLLFLLGASALVGVVAFVRRSARVRATTVVLLTALCLWGAETLAFGPDRAAGREQRLAAATLGPHLEEGEEIWVPRWVSFTGQNSALLFYLDHPVRIFENGEGPPPGSACLIKEAHLEWVGETERQRLDAVASVVEGDARYVLYRSSGTSD